jgi:opacity protein-like surface antigen
MGAGYDYAIMSNVRVGLTYVATYFPGKLTNTTTRTDAGVDAAKQKKKSTEQETHMVVRPVWNHAIALSVSVALKNSNAA